MSELRRDPVTNRWVVIATERAKRPVDFKRSFRSTAKESDCPFCPEQEKEPPLASFTEKGKSKAVDDPNWVVRVVPNLYPALTLKEKISGLNQAGPYTSLSGVGVHEVLVTNRDHEKELGLLSQQEVCLVIEAYLDRYLTHKRNSFLEYMLIMVNHGREAGMSKEHPHAQLFGLPLVPSNVVEELIGVRKYHQKTKSCVYCDLIRYEKEQKERIIYENERFLVFAPYASRAPFESWILPKRHQPFFESLDQSEQNDLADALKTVLFKLDEGLNDPPFNFYIHTTPYKDHYNGLFHWHLEIYPRLATFGGFELGSGVIINTTLPESCAEFLRNFFPK
jgi:UDPglucose--hexose-1-phosphate uridylyltransferase